jgi:hypothetical protein
MKRSLLFQPDYAHVKAKGADGVDIEVDNKDFLSFTLAGSKHESSEEEDEDDLLDLDF